MDNTTINEIIQLKNEIDSMVEEWYHSLAQKHGLTLEQFHLMVELDELKLDIQNIEQAPTVGDMAKSLKNSQNTMSERISRMEAKGLVTRVKDPKDRRISRIILTEDGKGILSEIWEDVTENVIIQALTGLSEDERCNLHDTLYKLKGILSKKS